ncbi:thermonuclease family protein, partial [bacterium]|nr:thermonuclease family protein [bacterium]
MKAFNLQKACSILVLVIAFIAFLLVLNGHGESYSVVKIISPTEILVIDANHSKKTVFVKNIKSFVVKPDENQLMLDKKLNITTAQSIGLGYLATNFAKNKLTNKSVKLDRTVSKKSDKVFSTIYVDRQNYGNLLLENGLAVKNNLKVTRELKKSIYRAEKLNLRIFNNKSHKYHKLTCKYGLLAHNIIVMPQSQIPKGAKPCGWCLKHHKRHKHFYKKHYKKYEKYSEKGFVDFTKIPYVAVPPKQLETSDMRFFLTDMTKVKKPDNRCQTPVCKALVNEINT